MFKIKNSTVTFLSYQENSNFSCTGLPSMCQVLNYYFLNNNALDQLYYFVLLFVELTHRSPLCYLVESHNQVKVNRKIVPSFSFSFWIFRCKFMIPVVNFLLKILKIIFVNNNNKINKIQKY